MATLRCAFCLSAPVLAPSSFLTSPATSITRPLPLYLRCAPRRTPPIRKRPRTVTPVATFRKNRPGESFKAQAVDLLLEAGRFLQSPPGQILLWAGLAWLVLTGRIGVLFDSFLILFAIVTIVPVIAMVGFRWWINRQLVQGTCPSCGAMVTGLKGQSFQCNVCGNTMQGENTGNFSVKDPSKATIDIDAKEVDDY